MPGPSPSPGPPHTPGPALAAFSGLDFTTPADGIAVLGPAGSDGAPRGTVGRLLLTGDGGANWQAVTW